MAALLDSQELLSFQLPYKHRPGTDPMPKHVLLDPTVMGVVIDMVVTDPEIPKDSIFSPTFICLNAKPCV